MIDISFFGINEYGIKFIKYLIENKDKFNIKLVSGKYKKRNHSDELEIELKEICKKNNLNYVGNIDINTHIETFNILKKTELAILGGYDKIVKDNIINIDGLKIINTHLGVIPYNRGCNPTIWSILRDEIPHGFTTYLVNKNIDFGKILDIYEYRNDNITSRDLYDELVNESVKRFDKIILKIHNNEYINIDEKLKDKRYYSKQGMPNDGYINWSWDVKNIKKFSNALVFPPYKPCKTRLNNEDIYLEVLDYKKDEKSNEYLNGEVTYIDKLNIYISSNNSIIICKLFENYEIKIGDIFESMIGAIHPIDKDFNFQNK